MRSQDRTKLHNNFYNATSYVLNGTKPDSWEAGTLVLRDSKRQSPTVHWATKKREGRVTLYHWPNNRLATSATKNQVHVVGFTPGRIDAAMTIAVLTGASVISIQSKHPTIYKELCRAAWNYGLEVEGHKRPRKYSKYSKVDFKTHDVPQEGRGQIIGGNIYSNDPSEINSIMNIVAQTYRTTKIKRICWHNSIRLMSGEYLSFRQLVEYADRLMLELRFDETYHQRIYVLHDDPDGQHIHIIANRVGINGKIQDNDNEGLIFRDALPKLDHMFGIKSDSYNDLLCREYIINSIEEALQNCLNSRLEFDDILSKKGINTHLHTLRGEYYYPRILGYTYEYKGYKCSGSKLRPDRKYSWTNLKGQIF